MSDGQAYELPTSELPTTENAYSSSRRPTVFATPDTMPDAPNSGSNMRTRPSGLGNQVRTLPTPTAGEAVRGGATQPKAETGKRPTLSDIRHLVPEAPVMPTPTASDATGGGQHPSKRTGHTRQLIDTVLGLTGGPTPPLFDVGSD